ncbi:hypothetical protein [Leptothoe spongobia]|nr:hypothetical protein [Leptothoe spongobia]
MIWLDESLVTVLKLPNAASAAVPLEPNNLAPSAGVATPNRWLPTD